VLLTRCSRRAAKHVCALASPRVFLALARVDQTATLQLQTRSWRPLLASFVTLSRRRGVLVGQDASPTRVGSAPSRCALSSGLCAPRPAMRHCMCLSSCCAAASAGTRLPLARPDHLRPQAPSAVQLLEAGLTTAGPPLLSSTLLSDPLSPPNAMRDTDSAFSYCCHTPTPSVDGARTNMSMAPLSQCLGVTVRQALISLSIAVGVCCCML
jgi:hypothetical protein